jgi:hypothetical protein
MSPAASATIVSVLGYVCAFLVVPVLYFSTRSNRAACSLLLALCFVVTASVAVWTMVAYHGVRGYFGRTNRTGAGWMVAAAMCVLFVGREWGWKRAKEFLDL